MLVARDVEVAMSRQVIAELANEGGRFEDCGQGCMVLSASFLRARAQSRVAYAAPIKEVAAGTSKGRPASPADI